MAIVCALDTKMWEKLVNFAVEEAKIRNEKLYFVHCIEVPKLGQMAVEDALEEVGEKIGRKVLEESANIAKAKGVEFETVLSKRKDVARFILEFADTVNASLIVVGTTKKTKTGKILFGSVAQEVILNARQPVVCLK
ncbi:MAG: universal stress protein [Archaeoglobaceae archaeon]|uniref:Universal stress protein n=1 Tax=Archaeoglobus fulgidus TaxID=2234 RepID=A0A7J3M2J3_ARCFL